jgi:heme/copper-type cytochrome/quinol oxidase subunit 3
VVLTVLALVFALLRWAELRALHTRWDQDAYGSTTWVLAVTHGTLIVAEIGEMLFMLGLFVSGSGVTERHYSDAGDSVIYWYFFTGSWIVLAAILCLVPRL